MREGKIRQALEERARLNTSFEDLHHKYGIPRSTLCDRAGCVESREKSHKDYQALTPALEDAMVKWALRMDSQEFPPRLDLFKATAEKLFHDTNASEPNATPQVLGRNWLRGFLNRHPNVSARYSTPMDHQRAFANHPGPIKDYFKKLKAVISKYQIQEENMWNMDEKGFILGTASGAKVIARAGRWPPRTTHDGMRELITVIVTCGAKRVMLPPMVVFKGTSHYKGWYSEVTDGKPAYFAYSPKGYTTDEIGLDWLHKLMPTPGRKLPAAPTPATQNTVFYYLMVTVLTTTFAFVSMHGITKLFWYLIQATQHTCYNLSMWDCFRHSQIHIKRQLLHI